MKHTPKTTKMLCEGALCIALSLALSYLKIPVGISFGGFGGSIDAVMLPLVLFAVRYGAPQGMLAAFAFGTLKYLVGNGFAVSWVSIVFDYSVAYAMVGLAGVLHKKPKLLPVAALIGCTARFAVHFFSGVTVYRAYMPEAFMGVSHLTPALYSLLYNGTYMLPNTLLVVALCTIIPLDKIPE